MSLPENQVTPYTSKPGNNNKLYNNKTQTRVNKKYLKELRSFKKRNHINVLSRCLEGVKIMGYMENNGLFICECEDSAYEVVINDDCTLGNIYIYLRRSDTKEFIGNICEIRNGEKWRSPEIEVWKSCNTGTDGSFKGDIRFEYELSSD